MFKQFKKNQEGMSVIEVLISIGMAGIIIVGVGNSLASSHKLDTASGMKEKALAYAKQSIEIVTEIKNDQFACRCDIDTCSDICTKASDGQTCTLFGGYDSCWTEYPIGLTNNYPLHLDLSPGGGWELAYGEEIIVSDPLFTRVISIDNLYRDADGYIVDSGGTLDINTKKVTVTVKWTEQNNSKEINLTTILTAWENLITTP